MNVNAFCEEMYESYVNGNIRHVANRLTETTNGHYMFATWLDGECTDSVSNRFKCLVTLVKFGVE